MKPGTDDSKPGGSPPSRRLGRRPARPWQPRYELSTLLMVMFIACITAAAGYYLVRAIQQRERAGMLTFILFTLAAPALVMVVVSLVWAFLRRLHRRR